MPTLQQRSPILVVLLSFFTLGVYFVYWVYRVNQEAAVLANDRYSRPLRSVLALTLGAVLIIPPYVTLWRTAERVGWATRAYSGFFANVFFSLLIPLLYPLWVQSKLNRKIGQWERQQQQIALAQRVQSRVVTVQSDLSDPSFSR